MVKLVVQAKSEDHFKQSSLDRTTELSGKI